MHDVEAMIRRVLNNTPRELLDSPVWCLVKVTEVSGSKKPEKLPLYASGAPRGRDDELDSAHDRSQLVTFDALQPVLRRLNADMRPDSPRERSYLLPGLALGPMPDGRVLSAIDFDDIAGNGTQELEREAINIAQSITEISCSRLGSHILGVGDAGVFRPARGVECFSGKRTLAYTAELKCQFSKLADIPPATTYLRKQLANGHAAPDEPTNPQPREPVTFIDGAVQQPSGNKFKVTEHGAHGYRGRDDYLSRQAYALRKKGMTIEQVQEVLGTINDSVCDPPMLARDVRRIAYGKRNISPDEQDIPQLQTREIATVELSELFDMDIRPREFVLEPVLPEQGLVMIHGFRGLGKTHCSIGIAVAVASAGEFLKWKAPGAAGVLFIDGEMPAALLQERFRNAVRMGGREVTCPVTILTPDMQAPGVPMPDLSTLEGQAAVERVIRDEHRLIILDNLSCLTSGVENEGEGWLPVQGWALRQRAKGRAVLMMHHSGKSGQQRGTSRREDVLDTVIGLHRPHDYSPEQGARFEVHIEKGRQMQGEGAAAFEAHLTLGRDGKSVWRVTDLRDTQEDRVLDMLELGMKVGDISKELKIPLSTAYRKVAKLKMQGRVKSENSHEND